MVLWTEEVPPTFPPALVVEQGLVEVSPWVTCLVHWGNCPGGNSSQKPQQFLCLRHHLDVLLLCALGKTVGNFN